MKLYNLLLFEEFYSQVQNTTMPIATAYKLSKLKTIFNSDIEFYQTELQKIFMDCVERDADGQYKISDDGQNYVLKPDKIQEFQTRYSELRAVEVEMDENLKLELDELGSSNMTPKQLENIVCFLK